MLLTSLVCIQCSSSHFEIWSKSRITQNDNIMISSSNGHNIMLALGVVTTKKSQLVCTQQEIKTHIILSHLNISFTKRIKHKSQHTFVSFLLNILSLFESCISSTNLVQCIQLYLLQTIVSPSHSAMRMRTKKK